MKTTKFLASLCVYLILTTLYVLTVDQFDVKQKGWIIGVATISLMIIYLGVLQAIIIDYLERLIRKHEDKIVNRGKEKAIREFMDFLVDLGTNDMAFRHDVINKEVPIRDQEGRSNGTTTVYQQIANRADQFIYEKIK